MSTEPETRKHSRENGNGSLPSWAVPVVLALGGLGVGGASGTLASSGQLTTAIQASEARVVGRIDVLAAQIDRATRDSERLAVEVSKLSDRLHKLEVDAARGGK